MTLPTPQEAEIAGVAELRAERDEADRRAGAAERKLARLEDEAAKRQAWLYRAKRDAGYDENVSFDVVWADLLRAHLQRTQEESRALAKESDNANG